MPASRRFVLAPGVMAQTALEEAVLLDARSGAYFAANDTATCVLRALLAGQSEAEIVDLLAATFAAPREQLQHDVRGCLDDWLQRGIVVAR
ncbi:MAG: hypothetical protein COS34_05635 [Lysobacterales bacterium CG02_land_8_20_14_3_00_62_12]|nr:MAG: hypothetical protein COS34_05635 [Xanthomonadales bacterium CG02_land_8_20_14_3_00_62_12]